MTEQLSEVEIGVDFGTLEQEMESEEYECESEHHDTLPEYHQGPGTWYAHRKCPRCSTEDVDLVCEKWADYAKSDNLVRCPDCKKVLWCREAYLSVVKK